MNYETEKKRNPYMSIVIDGLYAKYMPWVMFISGLIGGLGLGCFISG